MGNRVYFTIEGDADDRTKVFEDVPAPKPGDTIELDGAHYEVVSLVLTYWTDHPGEVAANVRVKPVRQQTGQSYFI